MATFKTEGIIVQRRNFDESGRLLTILTRDHGKILAIAKGARKLTSRKGASVELFNHCKFLIASGKSLGIVIEVQVVKHYPNLKSKLSKVGQGYLVLELIDKFCAQNIEVPQVFDLVKETLEVLEKPITYPQRKNVILAFKYRLMLLLGFAAPHMFGLREFPRHFGLTDLSKVAFLRPIDREIKLIERKIDELIEKTVESRINGNVFLGQLENLARVPNR